MPIRVALADDHEGIRTAIRCLLEHSSEIVVVGEATNGKAALKLVREKEPDVLVLDIAMPGMSGLDVMRELSVSRSPVRILLLSAYANYYALHKMNSSTSTKFMEKKDIAPRLLDVVRELATIDACEAVH
jgi:DNA-binding NarL/FixJ family response regulator